MSETVKITSMKYEVTQHLNRLVTLLDDWQYDALWSMDRGAGSLSIVVTGIPRPFPPECYEYIPNQVNWVAPGEEIR